MKNNSRVYGEKTGIKNLIWNNYGINKITDNKYT